MELDELKEVWTALDNRLKRNEELKESIILEMMKSKAGKLVNRFITLEIISVVIMFTLIPVCVYWLDRNMGKSLAGDIVVCLAVVTCIVYPFWGIFKIRGLLKFDLSKNVGNNIYHVNKYNIQLKREHKLFYFYLWPVFGILLILTYASFKATLPLWALLFCALIVTTLISYWMYKRYFKNIASILKSLDEIKELKEA